MQMTLMCWFSYLSHSNVLGDVYMKVGTGLTLYGMGGGGVESTPQVVFADNFKTAERI